jgi:hypothetical protein
LLSFAVDIILPGLGGKGKITWSRRFYNFFFFLRQWEL